MDLRRYIGIPYRDHGRGFDGCDCFGLLLLVLREEFGAVLPDRAEAYETAADPAGVAAAIEAGLARRIDGWRKRGYDESPEIGDGVLFVSAGRPSHVGVLVGTAPLQVLHVVPGMAFSAIERLDHPKLKRRAEGFYARG